MPTLIKMLFQMTTRSSADAPIPRTGGWSEAFWCNNNDLNQVQTIVEAPGGVLGVSIVQRRLALLPTQGTLVGYRMQAYNIVANKLIPTGGARPRVLANPGGWGTLNDIPGMGLQFAMAHTGQPLRTQLVLRGMPDARVEGGELTLVPEYATRIQNWINAMAANFGAIVMLRGGVLPYKVVEVSAGKVLTAKVPVAGVAVNGFVNVRRSKAEDGIRRGIKSKVTAVADGGRTITLQDWPWGPTRGGSVLLYNRAFAAYDATNSQYVRVVPRKVGGPFVGYVGKSKKKMA